MIIIKKKKKLDKISIEIYSLLKKRLGYRKTPLAIPLKYIEKCIGHNKRQIEYRIEKMSKLGYIEKWTTKHPTHFKITYYRIPLLNNNNKESQLPI